VEQGCLEQEWRILAAERHFLDYSDQILASKRFLGTLARFLERRVYPLVFP